MYHHHHIKRHFKEKEDEMNPYKLPAYNPALESDDNFDQNSINSLESFGPSYPHIDNYAHVHHHKHHKYPGRGLEYNGVPTHNHKHHKHIVKPAATFPQMPEWKVKKIAHHLSNLINIHHHDESIVIPPSEDKTSHNELLLLLGMGIIIFGATTLVSGAKF